MLGWLVSLINPVRSITEQLVKWKLKQADAKTEQARIEAEVEIATLEAQKQVVLAEQSNFFTRMVRPLWAFAFIIYTWKIVVWDKVLGWGVTDPLDKNMWGLMMVIAGAYFISRSAEKVVNKIWRT
jgi:hypothetical protein